ncbi:MAG: hypothetical protein ACK4UN_20700 [Limisphaerales bacterium]
MPTTLIYIQNRKNGRFWKDAQRWVQSPDRATPFNSASQAYHFALQTNIPDAEIVFQKHSKVESVLRDLANA